MLKQLEVLTGIKAWAEAALAAGPVFRTILGLENEGAPPDRVPVEGRIVLRRGSPGDAQVDLSPPTYNYDHQIPLQITTIADPVRDLSAAQVAAEILQLLSAAMLADRTAGGAVEFLDATAPDLEDILTSGSPLTCDVEATIVASYSTTSPL